MVLRFFLGMADNSSIILSVTGAEYLFVTFPASRYRLHLSVMVTGQAELVFLPEDRLPNVQSPDGYPLLLDDPVCGC